ncbi:OTU domain-containing protein 5-A-like [Xenia sp. Carnegie-2017]|uniref:OTU domain-containing protein 5-A-like n=1 Tax=Xenia sp. Carnegie-2017 TaxID=2897299 RepID=UPI001F0441B8|nr:OTU domain-containing protein 5-A-like [Xenia sp. Carnegie-2017]
MTILPKKKHQDSKKNEANTSNDLRHARSRNNCARTSGERANRSPDEINESSVYRSGNIELRNTSESSSNGKRRYRNTNNEYRRRDETGYNSEDEYDASKNDDQPSEEMERNFEKILKEKKGFVIKKTVEDGACLFRAVADQVYGDQEMHSIVRRHCMDYMVKNADHFSQYVTEDFDEYIKRKRANNCHGNNIEMQALSEMYNRTIEVYKYSLEPINTFHASYQSDYEPIRLSYHNNIHYNSIIDPYNPSVGVGLGLAGYNPKLVDKKNVHDAVKKSEEPLIEKEMLEDKLRATDWEATYEAMEEAVARESYLEWLKENERRSRKVQHSKGSAGATSSTSTVTSGESSRYRNISSPTRVEPDSPPPNKSPRHSPPDSPKPSRANSPKMTSSDISLITSSTIMTVSGVQSKSTHVNTSPKTCYSEGNSLRFKTEYGSGDYGSTAFGWEDDEGLLAAVLAESQKEYLDSLKRSMKETETNSKGHPQPKN